MPITKKRGAIFSIYADSPVQTTSALASSSSIPSKSSGSLTSPTRKSTVSAGIASRRALTALQPTALHASSASGQESSSIKGKGKAVSVLGDAKATITATSASATSTTALARKVSVSTRRTTASKSATTVTKRQIEVFVDVDEPPRAVSASIPPAGRKADIPSPAKRTRATPRKAHAAMNDENVPPPRFILPDSPASNTRSRARRVSEAGSGANKASLTASPVIRRRVLGEKVASVPEAAAAAPIRGKLATAKKGRAVLADAVLCDVSEAYGATASEPEGFRMQRT